MPESVNKQSVADHIAEAAGQEFHIFCSKFVWEYSSFVESEIELMVLVGFCLYNILREGEIKPIEILKGDEPSSGQYALTLRSQYQWNDYRIDFCFDIAGGGFPIFIECDGHDFHERTKEQAERDRSRDRAVQQAGIPILRFTGREIWRDPLEIADQIIRFFICRVQSVANENDGPPFRPGDGPSSLSGSV